MSESRQGHDRPESPLVWTDDGQPRSRLYGDVYYSSADGLAESRTVFLEGCGLPDAWCGRDRFTVGELGFGTGLNIVALLDLWRRERPDGARLHVFSIEAHPIAAAEAARALAPWPQVRDLAELLTARWPGRARGFHRVDLPEVGAILDLAVMEAGEALQAWTGRADAWFLDGFSPALNPQMWRAEVLDLVAARSAPGARAATFTVAGAVRRNLIAAGFTVDKKPGFGRKRERLEAHAPAGTEPPPMAGRRVAIIGAGIAGVSAARAVHALGGEPHLIEPDTPVAGASANPAALVTPRLDAGLGPPAQLFAQAFARAVQLYADVPEAVIARGVLQLASGPRDPERFAKILASDLFEAGSLSLLDPAEAAARLGETCPAGLDLRDALVVEPAALLAAWSGPATPLRAAALIRDADGWRVLDDEGQVSAQADSVIVAAGLASSTLLSDLPLSSVRGQASWLRTADPVPAAAWGGYVAPTRDGLLFGATHDRGDAGVDLRPQDHGRNLATLAKALPGLAQRLKGASLEGRAGTRAVTPDRLPLAGAAPDRPPGLFVLSGFGSRGFALAPLLAEHVAALALGAPSPLPAMMQALVDPRRFLDRAARRGHSGSGGRGV
jgi:tRNA 5-methylaminomethyl-2-thiouridine biosynthesis bifunctional protein